MPKAATWHLSDLWTDPPGERASVNRWWTNLFAGAIWLAWLYQAYKRDVTWDDWVGFAVAGALILSPALVSKFLGLKYGNGASTSETSSSETTTTKTKATAKS